jgi:predicted MFS family arabinose efflux permease
MVQSQAPRLTGGRSGRVPGRNAVISWALGLAVIPAGIAIGLMTMENVTTILVGGLLVFGVLFAVNSSLHSYLIVSFADADGVSLDVGFYYMANAAGRLLGTVLSGVLYQAYGLQMCLWVSAGFVALAAVISVWLPQTSLNEGEHSPATPDR